MKLYIPFLLLIILSFSSCITGNTDCCKYIDTDTISNKLYIERYQTFCGGVFGERIDHYITDSSKFRSNIGWNDEHNFLKVSLSDNIIYVYKLQTVSVEDTLEHTSLSKKTLFKYKDSGSATKNSIPLFGANNLACNDSYYFSSYKLGGSYFFTTDQFKCGNEFINANYLTDSTNFRLLIGFYDVGNGPFYRVNIKKDSIDFYKTQSHGRPDTIEVKTFKLSELTKAGLSVPCKN